MSMFKRSDNARPWRKPATVGVALAATAGMCVGFTMAANATGGTSTTDVHFVALSPSYKLESAKSISTNGTLSVAVLGTTTKIPYNATTVQMTLTGTGTTAGSFDLYPAGNPAAGPGQVLSWSGGGSDTETVAVNIGLLNEVTFKLVGATAKLTALVTGYSTQTTAAGISGLDGNSGQVLTNNGSGGTDWENPALPQAYSAVFGVVGLSGGGSGTTIGTLSVPAGSYDVSVTGDMFNAAAADYGSCYLLSPGSNQIGANMWFNTNVPSDRNAEVTTQGLLVTTGGSITLGCQDDNGLTSGFLYSAVLSAVQVGTTSGSVTSNAPRVPPTPPKQPIG